MQHQPPPSNHAITTEQIQKVMQANIFIHQPQPTTPQQPGGGSGGGGGQKPPFQPNSLRTQDQQPQWLQFWQQQQQQQLQAQMGIRPGGL
ncbi:hypothetical protein L6452_04501 [Arctium lappa]|uniref:Uncharacterized protein n=1 Tax=Arctium lappa TaxID=4217 RepID=A0ACB9EDC8_ARCLA|nr:hypothetical protein L6452_04501 [Arctium lappa]